VLRPASSVNWHNTSNGLLNKITFVWEKVVLDLETLRKLNARLRVFALFFIQ
jgi:hypothetical protein